MGYTLQAILAHRDLLTPPPSWIADSRVIFLQQNAAMVPMTERLHDQFAQQNAAGEQNPFSLFTYLPVPIATILKRLSQRGPVAYVEADFFGGMGEQKAVVWRDNKIIFGPIQTRGRGAISQALQMLGIQGRDHADEFAVVGLGSHRSNEDWLGIPNNN